MKADREILGDSEVAERLRAAAESATTSHGLERHYHPGSRRAAAHRARQAREWARTHWSDLKDGVERRPYSATAWALGVGFLTGIVLTTLVRSSGHREYH
jgi:ElaB/YqjD/DUF883 family membrane-anchored ribosome-binding protein